MSQQDNHVIGVDGGGTNTLAVLANLKGEILAKGKAGPSNPRNIGIEKAAENAAKAIERVLTGRGKIKVLSTFLGLPSLAEEYRTKKKEIKNNLLKQKGILPVFRGKIIIDSDQIVAFRAGTPEKDGILLITGTGSASHGWRGKKEVHVSGWGWLTDEGSAFWLGQKILQAVFKDLDGRGPKTLLTKLTFQNWSIKNQRDLQRKVYSKDYVGKVSSLAFLADKAGKRRDKLAKSLLKEAGRELAQVVKVAIKKLGFSQVRFPLVLSGGVFKSETVFKVFKQEIKRVAPKVKFILLKEVPVKGAVSLAIESIEA